MNCTKAKKIPVWLAIYKRT